MEETHTIGRLRQELVEISDVLWLTDGESKKLKIFFKSRCFSEKELISHLNALRCQHSRDEQTLSGICDDICDAYAPNHTITTDDRSTFVKLHAPGLKKDMKNKHSKSVSIDACKSALLKSLDRHKRKIERRRFE